MTDPTLRPVRTAQRFRRWLLAQSAGAVVGQRRIAGACPLARWLNDASGEGGACVGGPYWRYASGQPFCFMPRWAQRFMGLIDRGPPSTAGSRVLVDEADAAMARVLAERHEGSHAGRDEVGR